jgi:hypothetical protein
VTACVGALVGDDDGELVGDVLGLVEGGIDTMCTYLLTPRSWYIPDSTFEKHTFHSG